MKTQTTVIIGVGVAVAGLAWYMMRKPAAAPAPASAPPMLPPAPSYAPPAPAAPAAAAKSSGGGFDVGGLIAGIGSAAKSLGVGELIGSFFKS